MRRDRRRFLSLMLVATLLANTRTLIADILDAARSGPVSLAALKPYLEILIPQDETPGAVELGVPARLLGRAAENPGYRKLLIAGCNWLDRQAREMDVADFAALTADQRTIIVGRAAAAPSHSLPGRFFRLTRADAFSVYYARSEIWANLNYPGPPQPVGFPDYARPPVPPPDAG